MTQNAQRTTTARRSVLERSERRIGVSATRRSVGGVCSANARPPAGDPGRRARGFYPRRYPDTPPGTFCLCAGAAPTARGRPEHVDLAGGQRRDEHRSAVAGRPGSADARVRAYRYWPTQRRRSRSGCIVGSGRSVRKRLVDTAHWPVVTVPRMSSGALAVTAGLVTADAIGDRTGPRYESVTIESSDVRVSGLDFNARTNWRCRHACGSSGSGLTCGAVVIRYARRPISRSAL